MSIILFLLVCPCRSINLKSVSSWLFAPDCQTNSVTLCAASFTYQLVWRSEDLQEGLQECHGLHTQKDITAVYAAVQHSEPWTFLEPCSLLKRLSDRLWCHWVARSPRPLQVQVLPRPSKRQNHHQLTAISTGQVRCNLRIPHWCHSLRALYHLVDQEA